MRTRPELEGFWAAVRKQHHLADLSHSLESPPFFYLLTFSGELLRELLLGRRGGAEVV
jgi:hypothetical protein